MVKSRGLLRQLLAAGPFGLGILKSWMDLCQLPWIANPHPTPHRTAPVSSHSSSDRFLAVTSMGCFQQRSHGVYQKCRGPTYKFVLQYGTICVPQTTVPDLLNSNRVIPRPITPPKKRWKKPRKNIRNPRIGRLFHCSTTSSVHLFPSSAEAQMDGWFVVPRHVIQQYHLQFQGA